MDGLNDPEGTVPDNRSDGLRRGRIWLFMALAALGLAALYAASQALRADAAPAVARTAPDPVVVAVEPAALQDGYTLEEPYSGQITPRRSSQLGFSSPGRIEAILADTGDQVETGQTLARLDTRSLRARRNAAAAQVKEAEAALTLAEQTARRQSALAADGHVSQEVVDQAEAQADAARARVDTADAQRAALDVDLDLARITAPFAGTVTERMRDEGEVVSPGAPILALVESGAREARIGLPEAAAERLLAEIGEGGTVMLAVSGRTVEAVLRRVTGVIDPGRRTMEAVLDISPDAVAAPGAVARLPVAGRVEQSGYWTPLDSLTEAARGTWAVYIAAPQGGGHVAEKRLVDILHTEADRAFVRGTLDPGDLVIQTGIKRITPGQPVSPQGPVAGALLTSGR